MSDTISRADAIEAIRTLQTFKLFEGDDMILIDKSEVQTELMTLPSADRTGEWVEDKGANMTNSDAIEILTLMKRQVFAESESDNALDMAIEALEKQKGVDKGETPWLVRECPNCGYIYDEGDQVWGEPYCPHCGQGIDWSEGDD